MGRRLRHGGSQSGASSLCVMARVKACEIFRPRPEERASFVIRPHGEELGRRPRLPSNREQAGVLRMRAKRLEGRPERKRLLVAVLRDAWPCGPGSSGRGPNRFTSLQAGHPVTTCVAALRRPRHVSRSVATGSPAFGARHRALRDGRPLAGDDTWGLKLRHPLARANSR